LYNNDGSERISDDETAADETMPIHVSGRLLAMLDELSGHPAGVKSRSSDSRYVSTKKIWSIWSNWRLKTFGLKKNLEERMFRHWQ